MRNDGGNYEDVAGFCAAVPVERVAELDTSSPLADTWALRTRRMISTSRSVSPLRAEFEAQLKEEAELNARILTSTKSMMDDWQEVELRELIAVNPRLKLAKMRSLENWHGTPRTKSKMARRSG